MGCPRCRFSKWPSPRASRCGGLFVNELRDVERISCTITRLGAEYLIGLVVQTLAYLPVASLIVHA